MKIRKPFHGEITQGTLFNCAIADRYRDKQVHGLAITARCDIANDKYPVLNYLPVVTLVDWIHCDGIEILLKNVLRSTQGSFENTLKQSGVAVSVLTSVSRKQVVTSFFDGEDVRKTQKKNAKTAHDQADRLDRLDTLNLSTCVDRNWLLNVYDKEVGDLVKNLVNNKIASYYFLPNVTEDDDKEGHVVLLRESAFLPRRIASAIANGVERPISKNAEIESYLSFKFDDFAMPVGIIPSPNIEHLLQTFSHLFGRIGVDSPDDKTVFDFSTRKFLKVEVR